MYMYLLLHRGGDFGFIDCSEESGIKLDNGSVMEASILYGNDGITLAFHRI